MKKALVAIFLTTLVSGMGLTHHRSQEVTSEGLLEMKEKYQFMGWEVNTSTDESEHTIRIGDAGSKTISPNGEEKRNGKYQFVGWRENTSSDGEYTITISTSTGSIGMN